MSATVSALLRLRELILSGELPAGERLSELSVTERLGVSRTPVRAALARLEEEGLLEPIPSGGYAVRGFSESEIRDAIELRGTLEGLAARLAAERGASADALAELGDILGEIDLLLRAERLTEASFSAYIVLNEQFHQLLVALAGSPLVARQIARVVALPFASPSGFVRAQAALPQSRTILVVAQEQHRAVLEAIEGREGARAEALMREHAKVARRNLQLALRGSASLRLIPGGALIKRRARAS